MIVIEATLQAAGGNRTELIRLMQHAADAARREKGCILYRFASDLENADRFVLTEMWETEDALKAHFCSAAFKAFFEQLPGNGRFISDRAWHGPLTDYVPQNPMHNR